MFSIDKIQIPLPQVDGVKNDMKNIYINGRHYSMGKNQLDKGRMQLELPTACCTFNTRRAIW